MGETKEYVKGHTRLIRHGYMNWKVKMQTYPETTKE